MGHLSVTGVTSPYGKPAFSSKRVVPRFAAAQPQDTSAPPKKRDWIGFRSKRSYGALGVLALFVGSQFVFPGWWSDLTLKTLSLGGHADARLLRVSSDDHPEYRAAENKWVATQMDHTVSQYRHMERLPGQLERFLPETPAAAALLKELRATSAPFQDRMDTTYQGLNGLTSADILASTLSRDDAQQVKQREALHAFMKAVDAASFDRELGQLRGRGTDAAALQWANELHERLSDWEDNFDTTFASQATSQGDTEALAGAKTQFSEIMAILDDARGRVDSYGITPEGLLSNTALQGEQLPTDAEVQLMIQMKAGFRPSLDEVADMRVKVAEMKELQRKMGEAQNDEERINIDEQMMNLGVPMEAVRIFHSDPRQVFLGEYIGSVLDLFAAVKQGGSDGVFKPMHQAMKTNAEGVLPMALRNREKAFNTLFTTQAEDQTFAVRDALLDLTRTIAKHQGGEVDEYRLDYKGAWAESAENILRARKPRLEGNLLSHWFKR